MMVMRVALGRLDALEVGLTRLRHEPALLLLAGPLYFCGGSLAEESKPEDAPTLGAGHAMQSESRQLKRSGRYARGRLGACHRASGCHGITSQE